MDEIVGKAFELGLPGFILLTVLVIVITVIARLFTVFQKVTDKFDLLTERMAESNKELSNQLIKSSVTQESILSIMKETMVAVNNNTVRMAVLENKMESNYDKLSEISNKTDDTVIRLEDMHIKMEAILHKMN